MKRTVTRGGSSGEDERSQLAAHRARCAICKHPEREEIESEFLDWVSPREIAEHWKVASYRTIYRHAHAVGLFEKRRKNWLVALDCIVERAREVQVTAATVVAAIRLGMKIEGEGQRRDERRPKQGFLLSMEGLPRTNAVTGVAPGDEGTLQRAPTEGEKKKAERECESVAGEEENEGVEASPDASQASEPTGKQADASEPDPRVVLGEDGRVAGMAWPWPRKKIEFARVGRRWRGA